MIRWLMIWFTKRLIFRGIYAFLARRVEQVLTGPVPDGIGTDPGLDETDVNFIISILNLPNRCREQVRAMLEKLYAEAINQAYAEIGKRGRLTIHRQRKNWSRLEEISQELDIPEETINENPIPAPVEEKAEADILGERYKKLNGKGNRWFLGSVILMIGEIVFTVYVFYEAFKKIWMDIAFGLTITLCLIVLAHLSYNIWKDSSLSKKFPFLRLTLSFITLIFVALVVGLLRLMPFAPGMSKYFWPCVVAGVIVALITASFLIAWMWSKRTDLLKEIEEVSGQLYEARKKISLYNYRLGEQKQRISEKKQQQKVRRNQLREEQQRLQGIIIPQDENSSRQRIDSEVAAVLEKISPDIWLVSYRLACWQIDQNT